MDQFTPPDYAKIIVRWQHAEDNLPRWHAISEWLMAEFIRCTIAMQNEMAENMRFLSDIALQHALDLQPAQQLEAA